MVNDPLGLGNLPNQERGEYGVTYQNPSPIRDPYEEYRQTYEWVNQGHAAPAYAYEDRTAFYRARQEAEEKARRIKRQLESEAYQRQFIRGLPQQEPGIYPYLSSLYKTRYLYENPEGQPPEINVRPEVASQIERDIASGRFQLPLPRSPSEITGSDPDAIQEINDPYRFYLRKLGEELFNRYGVELPPEYIYGRDTTLSQIVSPFYQAKIPFADQIKQAVGKPGELLAHGGRAVGEATRIPGAGAVGAAPGRVLETVAEGLVPTNWAEAALLIDLAAAQEVGGPAIAERVAGSRLGQAARDTRVGGRVFGPASRTVISDTNPAWREAMIRGMVRGDQQIVIEREVAGGTQKIIMNRTARAAEGPLVSNYTMSAQFERPFIDMVRGAYTNLAKDARAEGISPARLLVRRLGAVLSSEQGELLPEKAAQSAGDVANQAADVPKTPVELGAVGAASQAFRVPRQQLPGDAKAQASAIQAAMQAITPEDARRVGVELSEVNPRDEERVRWAIYKRMQGVPGLDDLKTTPEYNVVTRFPHDTTASGFIDAEHGRYVWALGAQEHYRIEDAVMARVQQTNPAAFPDVQEDLGWVRFSAGTFDRQLSISFNATLPSDLRSAARALISDGVPPNTMTYFDIDVRPRTGATHGNARLVDLARGNFTARPPRDFYPQMAYQRVDTPLPTDPQQLRLMMMNNGVDTASIDQLLQPNAVKGATLPIFSDPFGNAPDLKSSYPAHHTAVYGERQSASWHIGDHEIDLSHSPSRTELSWFRKDWNIRRAMGEHIGWGGFGGASGVKPGNLIPVLRFVGDLLEQNPTTDFEIHPANEELKEHYLKLFASQKGRHVPADELLVEWRQMTQDERSLYNDDFAEYQDRAQQEADAYGSVYIDRNKVERLLARLERGKVTPAMERSLAAIQEIPGFKTAGDNMTADLNPGLYEMVSGWGQYLTAAERRVERQEPELLEHLAGNLDAWGGFEPPEYLDMAVELARTAQPIGENYVLINGTEFAFPERILKLFASREYHKKFLADVQPVFDELMQVVREFAVKRGAVFEDAYLAGIELSEHTMGVNWDFNAHPGWHEVNGHPEAAGITALFDKRPIFLSLYELIEAAATLRGNQEGVEEALANQIADTVSHELIHSVNDPATRYVTGALDESGNPHYDYFLDTLAQFLDEHDAIMDQMVAKLVPVARAVLARKNKIGRDFVYYQAWHTRAAAEVRAFDQSISSTGSPYAKRPDVGITPRNRNGRAALNAPRGSPAAPENRRGRWRPASVLPKGQGVGVQGTAGQSGQVAGNVSGVNPQFQSGGPFPAPPIIRQPDTTLTPEEALAARRAEASGMAVRKIGELAMKADGLLSGFTEKGISPVGAVMSWFSSESKRLTSPMAMAVMDWRRSYKAIVPWSNEVGESANRILKVFGPNPSAPFKDINGQPVFYKSPATGKQLKLTNADIIENYQMFASRMTPEQVRAAKTVGSYMNYLRARARQQGIRIGGTPGISGQEVDSYVHRTVTSVDAKGGRVYANEFGDSSVRRGAGAKISEQNARDYTTRAEGIEAGNKYVDTWTEEYASHAAALVRREADKALKARADQMSMSIGERVDQLAPGLRESLVEARDAEKIAKSLLKSQAKQVHKRAVISAQKSQTLARRAVDRAERRLAQETVAPRLEGRSRQKLIEQVGKAREQLAEATKTLREANHQASEYLRKHYDPADVKLLEASTQRVKEAGLQTKAIKRQLAAARQQAKADTTREKYQPGGLPITAGRIFQMPDALWLEKLREEPTVPVVGDLAYTLAQPMRWSLATGDDSAALNQNFNLLILDTPKWARSFLQSIIATLSETERQRMIRNKADVVQMLQTYAPEAWNSNPDFAPRGNIIASTARRIERIPVAGHLMTALALPVRLADEIFRNTRTFGAIALWEHFVEEGMTDEELHDLGSFIVKATGAARTVGAEKGALFAAAYVRSQFGLGMDAITNGGVQGRDARILFSKLMVKAALATIVYAIAVEGERDTRKLREKITPGAPNSFQIEGISLLGPWRPIVNLVSGLGVAGYDSFTQGDPTLIPKEVWDQAIGTFGRSKLQPFLGKLISGLTGTDVFGKPTSLRDQFLSPSEYLPLSVGETQQDIQAGGNPIISIIAAFSGARYYPDTPYERLTQKLDEEGVDADEFLRNSGARREAIAEHPELGDLYKRYFEGLKTGTREQRNRYKIVHDSQVAILAAIQELREGKKSPTELKDFVKEESTLRRTLREALLPDRQSEDDIYAPLYDAYEQATNPLTKEVDFDKATTLQEAYLAEHPELREGWEKQQYTVITDDPVEAELAAGRRLVNAKVKLGPREFSYYGSDAELWKEALEANGMTPDMRPEFASPEAFERHIGKQAVGVDVADVLSKVSFYQTFTDFRSAIRVAMIQQNPKLGAALRFWYGINLPDTKLDPQTQEAITAEIERLHTIVYGE